MKNTLFAVLKLSTTIEQQAQGQWRKGKLEGCAGYIPVFETEQEAIENSGKGKYQILQIVIEEESEVIEARKALARARGEETPSE